ncbi:MAG: acetyl-CoA carboxylase biotin carboxylase subunit [Eggerthellaceae bacterium]
MFKKVLIANRGEIAVRIERCCREMGIETVAVYSTADKDALHVQFADESVCIGGPQLKDSYLNMPNIIAAGIQTGCDAVHPGYGLLSENAEFARLVESSGMVFIGPSGDVIDQMGNKAQARKAMQANNVPVVPGSPGVVSSPEEAKKLAEEIGYPLLVKAAAGGGGRGMRRVYKPEDLADEFLKASTEAEAAFGDGSMYIEHLVENPKHVEIQILADKRGNVIYLGERDCSIQRRNQKMIEEAPCPILSAETRKAMGEAAVRAAKAVGYVSAGTVEFVMDLQEHFYFIEMNTRIQVEHPITEAITGIDIVREQIRIAAGLSLRYKQEDIHLNGHAIECRVNAEDPEHGFRPSPGDITFLHLPGGFGTRIDTALYQGCSISPYYDSMIGKIIVWAPTRLEAIRRMRRALEEITIEGVHTNLDFEHVIFFKREFLLGVYTTQFIAKHSDAIIAAQQQTLDIALGISEEMKQKWRRRKD